MRKIVYGLLGFASVLIPLSATSAAEAEKPSPIKLDANLTDGSRIKGEIPPPYRPFKVLSAELGELSVPPTKIAVINFNTNHTETTIHLLNGDKVQGALGIDSIKMTTLFGPITIPVSKIRELQFHAQEGSGNGGLINPDDWDSLPFPQDSNWPGDRGVPPRFENGEVILQGAQDVRSKKVYSAPMTVECEVMLEERSSTDGSFQLRLVAEGESANVDAKRFASLGLGYRRNGTDQLFTSQRPNSQHDFQVIADLPIRAGQPYRIKLEVQQARWRITVNGQTYEVTDVSLPSEHFYIQLYGWQPTDRWHVRSFKVY
jgi:hypothetical protein